MLVETTSTMMDSSQTVFCPQKFRSIFPIWGLNKVQISFSSLWYNVTSTGYKNITYKTFKCFLMIVCNNNLQKETTKNHFNILCVGFHWWISKKNLRLTNMLHISYWFCKPERMHIQIDVSNRWIFKYFPCFSS